MKQQKNHKKEDESDPTRRIKEGLKTLIITCLCLFSPLTSSLHAEHFLSCSDSSLPSETCEHLMCDGCATGCWQESEWLWPGNIWFKQTCHVKSVRDSGSLTYRALTEERPHFRIFCLITLWNESKNHPSGSVNVWAMTEKLKHWISSKQKSVNITLSLNPERRLCPVFMSRQTNKMVS